MGQHRIFAILVAYLSCQTTGCLAVYSTRPVEVVVTRTDTGQPAVNVPVKVSYLSMLVLNQPKDVQGTTDATGRVTLPMANFLAGPYLQAGTTKFGVEPITIRDGGLLTYKPSATPEEPIPTFAVRLVPRQQSLIQRVLGIPSGSKPKTRSVAEVE